MSWVELDRWSCPECSTTCTFEGSPASVAAHRRKAQEEHGKRHHEEAVAKVRLEIALCRRTKRRAA